MIALALSKTTSLLKMRAMTKSTMNKTIMTTTTTMMITMMMMIRTTKTMEMGIIMMKILILRI
jgi:hypothetical protein